MYMYVVYTLFKELFYETSSNEMEQTKFCVTNFHLNVPMTIFYCKY